jgi:LysM repeat protein
MHRRTSWLILSAFAGLGLAWYSGSPVPASAQAGKPVITTPTPTALPAQAGGMPGGAADAAANGPFVSPGSGPEQPAAGQEAGSEQARPLWTDSFVYEVQPGDTLWKLAMDFGRDLDTMSCATRPLGADAETLVPGQTIAIPGLRDLCYTVVPGDTLPGIAARYGLTVRSIAEVAWNGFDTLPFTVQPRQRVLLPGVLPETRVRADLRRVSRAEDEWSKTLWPEWRYGDGHFIWPVVGPISQYAHDGHWALDIAVDLGTPVQAADRGTVALAGWNEYYGFRVVIDHGNDYVTLYAHLNDIYVEPGQVVGKGQVIGSSGANGNITGPHLHFEIRDFGVLTDPWRLLPH